MIKKIILWIKYWLWDKPISKPDPPKLTDVQKNYVVIKYHGQMINLHVNEVPLWNNMNRHDRRGMAKRFESMEKDGRIRFEKINGKMICIKNKNYENSLHCAPTKR
jgi:hypothetical protein